MALSFAEHLDLLELHGRHAVESLGRLSPDTEAPPRGEPVRMMAEEHWSTLEIWAWSLENRTLHWSQCPERRAPAEYATLVAAIASELGRLARSLTAAGPENPIEYFDRPGTASDVARLLAHEAIVVAHGAGLAAATPALPLTPTAASDGIDQALRHWSAEETGGKHRHKVVLIRCTDTGEEWHLALNGDEDFRLVAPADSAVVVAGQAQDVLWWLHGHATRQESVTLDGDPRTIRDLRSNLMLPAIKEPKRRWF